MDVTPDLVSIFVYLAIGAGLAGILAIAWHYFKRSNQASYSHTSSIPSKNFSFAVFERAPSFNRDELSARWQSDEWQNQMKLQGQAMKKSQVQGVLLVHGTFVGDDPTGFLSALRHLHPTIEKHLASRMRRILKKSTDAMLKDNGNFTESYCDIFESALGMPCSRFTWTSENHHLARLSGAASLANAISSRIKAYSLTSDDRLLLLGHSHAGQLFALLMQLVQKSRLSDQLMSVLEDIYPNLDELRSSLVSIRDFNLDFVTLGAPVVYAWPQSGKFRILHITNHRGQTPFAGSLRGILHTRDGDYIQQLGILGTDAFAATPNERRLNKLLDHFFGAGRDLMTWQTNIAKKIRVSPYGRTVLVDYLDHSTGLPNFTSSLFGHGVYTRYETMLFNIQLISKMFYQ